jgi:hypothetical protein
VRNYTPSNSSINGIIREKNFFQSFFVRRAMEMLLRFTRNRGDVITSDFLWDYPKSKVHQNKL